MQHVNITLERKNYRKEPEHQIGTQAESLAIQLWCANLIVNGITRLLIDA